MEIETVNKNNISENFLHSFLRLNNSYNPFLGPLNDYEHLDALLNKSLYTLVLKDGNLLKGFCVVFRENSKYESKNYHFFKQRHKKFLYVDRICVSEDLLYKGFGTKMYEHVFENNKANVPVCAEVNIVPVNKESIKFHEKMGFKKVCETHLNPKYGVRYYERCL